MTLMALEGAAPEFREARQDAAQVFYVTSISIDSQDSLKNRGSNFSKAEI